MSNHMGPSVSVLVSFQIIHFELCQPDHYSPWVSMGSKRSQKETRITFASYSPRTVTYPKQSISKQFLIWHLFSEPSVDRKLDHF